jgi:phage repressor protein C with HTH and peptisase S24 domain
MTTPAQRLKEARTGAGFATAAEFAATIEDVVAESSYRSLENGTRNLTPAMAKKLAPALGRTWKELLFGDDDVDADVIEEAEAMARTGAKQHRARTLSVRSETIDELDVRAAAGFGLEHAPDGAEEVVAEWQLPTNVIRGQTTAPTSALKIITVYGDSQVPDFNPGERVLVDTSDRVPSPPGVFAIWDGVGLVIKRIEVIPYSEPPRVRLISRNKEYEAYERHLSEVHINGRVIGKWQWT